MRLVVHPDATAEVVEAADWYDRRALGLGDDLLAEIDAAFDAVARQPRAWPEWPGAPALSPPIRRYLLPRFRFYAVAYQTYSDHILILAVAHAARRPFYWHSRATPSP